MEAPEPSCPAPSSGDQPAPVPGPPVAPSGQASPRLTLGPVILPPEQGLPHPVFLKALPIPLYHTVPPGGLQPRAPLVMGSLDGGNVPFILSPLLPPEGPSSAQLGKPAAPTLTVSIMGALPVLSSGPGPSLGHPGKVRNAGKYLCPHCGRDCLKPSVLEKHIRSHTGERPFPCATCRIAFKTQSNLYKHRRTQTHLNNSRLSLESEGAAGGLLDEGERTAEASTVNGNGSCPSQRMMGREIPEGPPSAGAHPSLGAQNQGPTTEAAPCPGSTLVHGEAPPDSTQMASPGLPPAGTQPRWKLPEPKPCSLPRQQEASWEKHWEAKTPEGRLHKCESTDSGYLSRSDSAEQPALPPSPLHSLSERSAESEGEGGLGPGPGGTRAEPGAPGSSLELEKKRLEERIARLISHNQAVVGDPQLDHVRPRKTVLSKQGSIDLPTPYTYKDSFHFDIRALEPGRRRAALRPACSTSTPLDKTRPLFFHSVPTQLSTTVECVPVTRSNSLPFIEGSRTWPDPRDLQDPCPRTQKPLSLKPTPARLGCRSGLAVASIPSGHPRALVRQAAVEDLPCTPTGDPVAPAEDPGRRRGAMEEGALCRGRMPGKKGSPRRLKMFSQDKWRVYGNETFQRIYQKAKTSPQGGQKAREARGVRDRPDPPPQGKAAGRQDTAPSQGPGAPATRKVSVEAKSGSWGSLPAPEAPLDAEPPTQVETVARAVGSGLPEVARAVSSPGLGHGDAPCSSIRSPLCSPDGNLKAAWPMAPTPGPPGEGDRGPPGLVLPDSPLEMGNPGGGGTQESGLRAHAVLRRPGGGSEEAWAAENKIPSGRKKPKVDSLGPQEQPGLLGAENPHVPVGTASPPAQKQESDSGEMSGRPHGSAEPAARALEDASSGAPAASPRRAGLEDKEPTLPPATGACRHHSQVATQLRAPSVLTIPAEGTFPPKYLLRVPQGEAPSGLPVTQGPGLLCPSGWPEERAGPGTSGSPSPAPSGAEGIPECPSWSRQRDGRTEARAGREERDGGDAGTLAAGESPGTATVAPLDTASAQPSPRDLCATQNTGGNTHAAHQPCAGGDLTRAGPSGGVLNLWAPRWGLGWPPEKAPKVLLSEPAAGLTPSCSLQPSSVLMPLTRPQALPDPALAPLVGTPRSCGGQSPFPSLRAEPRLTWCCLSRSRPLPAEQKEKPVSVCSVLNLPGGSHGRDTGPDAQPVRNRGRTRTGPGGGGLAPTPQISYPAAPGMRSQGRSSDPAGKKGLSPRRVKTSRGDSKQKRRRVNPKRYEGAFWQSRAPLRASRRRKPLWVPRRSCSVPLHGAPEPRETLKHAGLNLPGEPSCATLKLSLASGNGGKEEGDNSPSSSSRTVKEADKLSEKDTCPSAGEHSDCSHNHDPYAMLELSLPSNVWLGVAVDDPPPHGRGLQVGLLETPQLPSQGQVATEPTPGISSALAQEPSSFGSPRTFPRQDTATSAATTYTSPGPEACHTMLGTHRAEPQGHSWAAGEALAPGSPAGRAAAGDISPTLLPGKLSLGPMLSDSASSGFMEKNNLEIPALGPSLTSPPQEEGGHQAVFSSRGQYECVETATPCPALEINSEKCQVSGLLPPKGHVAPLSREQPSEVLEAPSRSTRKRSLEGMRKQTRVELSDSSSDDEDRLVIEL